MNNKTRVPQSKRDAKREYILDMALMQKRRVEPSRPFREYMAEGKSGVAKTSPFEKGRMRGILK